MLAKYGYIEPAERTGREKPWRLVSRSRDLRPDVDDPASIRAVEAMAGLFVEHEVERIRHALAKWPSEPAGVDERGHRQRLQVSGPPWRS